MIPSLIISKRYFGKAWTGSNLQLAVHSEKTGTTGVVGKDGRTATHTCGKGIGGYGHRNGFSGGISESLQVCLIHLVLLSWKYKTFYP